MKIAPLALPVALLALSACTSVEGLRPEISAKPLPSRLDEIAYLNTLRMALQPIKQSDEELSCFDGRNLKPFKSKLGQGYRSAEDPEQFVKDSKGKTVESCIKFKDLSREQESDRDRLIGEYLDAGFGLTDIYCNRFFTVAIASQQNRNFAHSELASVDNLVTAVLGAAGAGETALAATGAAFGFGGKSLEGYDLAYLVSPNMPDVQRLVTAEQRTFRASLSPKKKDSWPTNYLQARRMIEAYAHTCSFSGMKQLVDKAVKDRTDGLNPDQSTDDGKNGDGAPLGTPDGDGKQQRQPATSSEQRLRPQMANPPG